MSNWRKVDTIETIAMEFWQQLNELRIELNADFDDDCSAKLEEGRKMARRWLRRYGKYINE